MRLARILWPALAALVAAGAIAPAHAGWPHSPGVNVLLSPSGGYQEQPMAVADGGGGAFVVRTEGVTIVAQRLDAQGVRAPGWPADGITVSLAAGGRTLGAVVADGFGGFIAAWEDYRSGESPTPMPTHTPTPTLALTEPAQAPVQYLVDVEDAIIQIEAQGKYFSPKFSKVTSDPGRGSGFIIDPSGLALTTHHAVAGAESIQVWVGGDRSKPYTAEVIAASECYDLALIDLEGEGFTYLGWVDQPLAVGQKVYAAGYPLGSKQFLINGGEIATISAGKSPEEVLLPVMTYNSESDPGMPALANLS